MRSSYQLVIVISIILISFSPLYQAVDIILTGCDYIFLNGSYLNPFFDGQTVIFDTAYTGAGPGDIEGSCTISNAFGNIETIYANHSNGAIPYYYQMKSLGQPQQPYNLEFTVNGTVVVSGGVSAVLDSLLPIPYSNVVNVTMNNQTIKTRGMIPGQTPYCRTQFQFTSTNDYYGYNVLMNSDGMIFANNRPKLISRDDNTRELTFIYEFIQTPIFATINTFLYANIFGGQSLVNVPVVCTPTTVDPFNSINPINTTYSVGLYDPVIFFTIAYQEDFYLLQFNSTNQSTYFYYPYRLEIGNLYYMKILRVLNQASINMLISDYNNAHSRTYTLILPNGIGGGSNTYSFVSVNCTYGTTLWSRDERYFEPSSPELYGVSVHIEFTSSGVVPISQVIISFKGIQLARDKEIYGPVYKKELLVSLTQYHTMFMQGGYFNIEVFTVNGQVDTIYSVTNLCKLGFQGPDPVYLYQSLSMVNNNAVSGVVNYTSLGFLGTPAINIGAKVETYIDLVSIPKVFNITTVKSQFPFGFFGNSDGGLYRFNHQYGDEFDFISTNFSNTINDVYKSYISMTGAPLEPSRPLDLLNPIVRLTIEFNTSPSNSYFKILINDTIGISEDSCTIQLRALKFPITSSTRIKGDHLNGEYIIPFQMKPEYCDTPQLYCQDIRGNDIQVNMSTGANLISVTSYPSFCQVPSPRLIHIDYIYKNLDTVLISATFTGPVVVTAATILVYRDYENTQLETQSVLPLLNRAMPGVYQFNGSVSISTSKTKTYYIGIQYTSQNGQSTLTTKDIEFFIKPSVSDDQIMRATQGDTKFIIRNTGYVPLPFIKSVTLNGSTVLNIEGYSSFLNVKNLTVVQIFNGQFYPTRNGWIGTNQDTTSIQVPLTLPASCGSRFRAYVETMCDYNDNCERYPMFGFLVLYSPTPTQCLMNYSSYSLGVTIVPTPNIIDVSGKNRTVSFQTTISSGILSYKGITPILYITEKISNYRIQCKTKLISFTSYSCDIEIPLNWGLRGVELSLWGITDMYGGVIGSAVSTNLTLYSSSVNQQTINLWDYQFDKLTGILSLEGSNFGYQPMVRVSTLTTNFTLSLQITSSTTAFIDTGVLGALPNGFRFDIGNDTYYVVECTNQCYGNGVCTASGCQCYPGYQLPSCAPAPTSCPNNCTSSTNGVCVDSKICNCYSTFQGPDCSQPVQNTTGYEVVTNPTNPSTTIGNFTSTNSSSSTSTSTTTTTGGNPSPQDSLTQESKQTVFSIKLVSVEEYALDGTLFITHPLVNWTLVSQTQNQTVYQVTIQQSCNITVTVTTFEDSQSVPWLGSTIQMPPKSVKYNVKTVGYNFNTKLNTMAFVWQTEAEAPRICGTDQIEIGGSTNGMNWFVIPANQLKLYSRFTDTIKVDNDIVKCTNRLRGLNKNEKHLTVVTAVPHFLDSIEIDPDFSALIDLSSGKVGGDCGGGSTDSTSSKPIWKVVVIVVSVVVGVSLITVVTVVILKKNSINLRIKFKQTKSKFKMSKLSN